MINKINEFTFKDKPHELWEIYHIKFLEDVQMAISNNDKVNSHHAYYKSIDHPFLQIVDFVNAEDNFFKDFLYNEKIMCRIDETYPDFFKSNDRFIEYRLECIDLISDSNTLRKINESKISIEEPAFELLKSLRSLGLNGGIYYGPSKNDLLKQRKKNK